jgi:hypothetical protein
VKKAKGRPVDSPEKRRRDELEGGLLYLEYLALREHVKGRTREIGHRDALLLLATMKNSDPQTIRRKIRKVAGPAKVWDLSERVPPTYLLTKKN